MFYIIGGIILLLFAPRFIRDLPNASLNKKIGVFSLIVGMILRFASLFTSSSFLSSISELCFGIAIVCLIIGIYRYIFLKS